MLPPRIVFAATVVVTRLVLWLRPTDGPTVLGFRVHHWVWGLAIAIVAIAVDAPRVRAVGAGLIIDELAFVLGDGHTHADNYSWWSLTGTAAATVAIFMLWEG